MKYASRTSKLFFNFSEYGHLLLSGFFAAGGKIVIRDFHSPGETGASAGEGDHQLSRLCGA